MTHGKPKREQTCEQQAPAGTRSGDYQSPLETQPSTPSKAPCATYQNHNAIPCSDAQPPLSLGAGTVAVKKTAPVGAHVFRASENNRPSIIKTSVPRFAPRVIDFVRDDMGISLV